MVNPGQYLTAEFAVLSQRWLEERHEVYPQNLPRMNLIDTWAGEDGISQSAGIERMTSGLP